MRPNRYNTVTFRLNNHNDKSLLLVAPADGPFPLSVFFFTLFGINVLVAAYGLKDPISFVMTFFSASFIILIGLALFVGIVARMIKKISGAHPPGFHKKNTITRYP